VHQVEEPRAPAPEVSVRDRTTRWNLKQPTFVGEGMDELPDEVMAEIREHVRAGRREWEDSLRELEEQRLLKAVLNVVSERGFDRWE
jgi:hypothetical protein